MLALFAFSACGTVTEESKPEDQQGKAMVGKDITYTYEGTLEDLKGGKIFGTLKANYANENYDLLATFANLPKPEEGMFYEGWIVRKGDNFDVISTGRVKETEGVYSNVFNSDKDLTDHDLYILTLEAEDGDATPGEHVLEGALKKI